MYFTIVIIYPNAMIRLFFICCLITSSFYAQTDNATIGKIKVQFSKIKTQIETEMLTKLETAYFCEDSRITGSIIYYFQKKELKAICHVFDQGHSSNVHEYYVEKGRLFFYFNNVAYDNDQPIYDKDTGALIDHKENWSIHESRVYLKKESAIKCLIKQYTNEDLTAEIKKDSSFISNYFKNEETSCNPTETKKLFGAFNELLALQKSATTDIKFCSAYH